MAIEVFNERDLAQIEAHTKELGLQILGRLRAARPRIWHRRWWDERLMGWAMYDESVKVQMFRFVDVLPMLTDNAVLVRHLQEYLGEVEDRLPAAVRMGLRFLRPDSLLGTAVANVARRGALGQARRFIAGTTTDEVLAAAAEQRRLKRAFTLDILGEAVTSESEADHYQAQYLNLLETLGPAVARWPEVPQIDRPGNRVMPRLNLSVKLSALDSQFDPVDPEGSYDRVTRRLRPILRSAQKHGAQIHVDMESYDKKSLTLDIFRRVLLEEEFRQWEDVGIVIQAYLRDAEADLMAMVEWARQRGRPVWIRLVKGAYWDYETVHARSERWPVPVFDQKWETDATFERLSRYLLANRQHLRPAIASHNVRSLAHAMATARQLGLSNDTLELQMLYGMGDEEKQVLVEMGYPLRVYMPYGELIPGMAYLVRRLLENTSNNSFLRVTFAENLSPEKLLMNPLEQANASAAATTPPPTERTAAHIERFQNEPLTDFSQLANRQAMQDAIARVKTQLGVHYPLIIEGRPSETAEQLTSVDPSAHARIVGTTASAGKAEAEEAVAAARRALSEWFALGVEKRAEFLFRAADVMRRRRMELAAWEVLECGKGWREADGDVCEAIDFCNYYALDALDLMHGGGLNVPGEENRFEYIPRGVAAVIAPWNFPLAILTGMTVAALVTGNTVVMKPAEQSPVVAAKLMEIFTEIGLPPGVANYLPGKGEVAGAALVDHPDVALIAFTGSRQVGLTINRRAAEISASGLTYVKRVIAEMGGKNGIIVDDDADLDEAVLGVVRSAFGYQGQKCSACSRAIVLDAVYDQFVPRLIEAARSLQVGPAELPGTSVGPLIDAESQQRVRKYIEIGRQEGREVLAVDVGPLAEQGYFVGPHIFTDIAPTARLAQEEVFGPVLAVIRAADLDEAIRILNGTDYALTAGIFSRSPAHLDRARRELLVGNLYLNRAITGALVGRQPFGGFKMSGIGSKAGGRDYLLQFVLPRTITENTLRRGFAPPPETE